MENIKKGRVLRDTLYGRVRIGTAILKTAPTIPTTATSASSSTSTIPTPAQPQELVVVIKEYDKVLVEKKQTKDGHPVHEDAKNELRLHALLCREPCPHIIRLYDLRADATHYYAVLEYASKGEFFAFVSHPQFTRDHARHFFRQLVVGVQFMHDHGIAHRDLSLENILLDEQHVLKICDFGVACEAKPGQLITEAVGPVGKLKYMAPEVFARHPYSPRKADIWSIGVILFIMLVQVFPFDRPTLDDDRFVHACSDRINHMLQSWQKPLLDPWTIDLFRHIFCPVEQRYEAAQILQHPYCAGDPKPTPTASTTTSSSPQPTGTSAAASSTSSSTTMQTDDSAMDTSSSMDIVQPTQQQQIQQRQHQPNSPIPQQQQQPNSSASSGVMYSAQFQPQPQQYPMQGQTTFQHPLQQGQQQPQQQPQPSLQPAATFSQQPTQQPPATGFLQAHHFQ